MGARVRAVGERLRVAVTGATGHVGTNLVRALRDRGDEVRVLQHHEAPGSALPGVESVPGDVLKPESLRETFAGVELVFHLAAVISITGDRTGIVRRTNVEGAQNAAVAARDGGVRRFVHVSSVHAFDLDQLGAPITEQSARATRPELPAYDRSKAEGEAAVRAVFAQGLDGVVVHPSGVIGPVDPRPSRMGQLFLDLQRGALPAVVPGGFDWVDVRDVVTGMLAAAARGRSGESYILSGQWCSIAALAVLAEELTGKPAPRFVCPLALAQLGAPFMTLYNLVSGREPLYTSEALHALGANRELSHAKAAQELDYVPRPLRETVHDLYADLRASGRLAL